MVRRSLQCRGLHTPRTSRGLLAIDLVNPVGGQRKRVRLVWKPQRVDSSKWEAMGQLTTWGRVGIDVDVVRPRVPTEVMTLPTEEALVESGRRQWRLPFIGLEARGSDRSIEQRRENRWIKGGLAPRPLQTMDLV